MIAATLLATTLLTAPVQDEREIPPPFRGEWNETPADCGTANNDSRLILTATTVEFYESSGRVRGAFLNGPYEMIFVADLSGEGQTWMMSYKLMVAADGSYVGYRDETTDELFVRYRCPETGGR